MIVMFCDDSCSVEVLVAWEERGRREGEDEGEEEGEEEGGERGRRFTSSLSSPPSLSSVTISTRLHT